MNQNRGYRTWHYRPPNLVSRRQFNARRKLTARLAEEIRKDVAVSIDGSEDRVRLKLKGVERGQ